MSAEPPQSLEPLGRYELIRKLATGGMAELFLARERGLAGLERLVVIKRILPHLADDPDFVEMFLREARIIARLNHPNVIQIYELGEEDDQYYIAMEFLHGISVKELMTAARDSGIDLPIDTVLTLVAGACRGAHAAHTLADEDGNPLGVVHRDISPHNVMITASGDVKLLDFGIAKATEGLDTTIGGLKGKYAYMSPEQCMRRDLDHRSDVFALGIVLWELLTGQRLFTRHSELETMQAIIQEPAPSVYEHNPDLPEGLDAILEPALAKDPDQRYSDAEAFRHAILMFAHEAGFLLDSEAIAFCVQELASALIQDRAPSPSAVSLVSFPKRESTANVEDEPKTVVTRPGRKAEPDIGREEDEPPSSEAAPPPASSRSHVALVVAGVLLLSGALFFLLQSSSEEVPASPAPHELSGPPLLLAWAPVLDDELMLEELEPLREYLEKTLERPVTFSVPESYGRVSRMLVEGKLDFAIVPPLTYLRTRAQLPELIPLVIKEVEGLTASDAYLMVRSDAPFVVLDDLNGKRFCFTDKNSTSGNFLPRDFLERVGRDPTAFIGQEIWSGDHQKALEDLVAKRCDVAATYSGNLERTPSYGIPRGALRIIAVTGHIPQDVLVARPETTEQDRTQLRDALLAFDPAHLGVKELGSVGRITGFKPVSDHVFDALRGIVDEAP